MHSRQRSFVSFMVLRMLLLALVFVSLAGSGCTVQKRFSYPSQSLASVNPNPPSASIVVLPARDARGTTNRASHYWLFMVPLVPFGSVSYQRPTAGDTYITIGDFYGDLSVDIPRAIADHLAHAGYASRVFYHASEHEGVVGRVDYVLESTLREVSYSGYQLSYGLSFLAGVLWAIGIPMGISHVDVTIDLRLRDRAGQTIWSDTITGSSGLAHGLYYNLERDVEAIAAIVQEGVERVIREHPLASR